MSNPNKDRDVETTLDLVNDQQSQLEKKTLAEIAVENQKVNDKICAKLSHLSPNRAERFPFTDDFQEYPLLLEYLDPLEVKCPGFRIQWKRPSEVDVVEHAYGTTIRILDGDQVVAGSNPDQDEPLDAALAMPANLGYVQELPAGVKLALHDTKELTTSQLEDTITENIARDHDNDTEAHRYPERDHMIGRVAIVNISGEFNKGYFNNDKDESDSGEREGKEKTKPGVNGPTKVLCYRTTLAASLRQEGGQGVVMIPPHCGLYIRDVVVLREAMSDGHELMMPKIKARKLPVVSVVSMPGIELRDGDEGYELVHEEDDDDGFYEVEGGAGTGGAPGVGNDLEVNDKESAGTAPSGSEKANVDKRGRRRGERTKERHRKPPPEWEEKPFTFPKPPREWSPVRRALKRKIRLCLRMLAIKGHAMVVAVLGAVWSGNGVSSGDMEGRMDRLWMEMECWVDVLNEEEFSGGFFKEVWFSVSERRKYRRLGGFGVFEKRFDGEVVGVRERKEHTS